MYICTIVTEDTILHHWSRGYSWGTPFYNYLDNIMYNSRKGHHLTTLINQSGPKNPSVNLVLLFCKTVWWGHVRGGSMTTTLVGPCAWWEYDYNFGGAMCVVGV